MGLKRNSKGELAEVTPLRSRKGSVYIKGTNEKFKISRSKFSSFLDCKRCFYLDRVKGLKDPGMPGWSLNIAVDELLKKEFDLLREQKKPHPIFKKHNLNLVPFQHEKMNEWRENFQGLKFHYKKANLMIQGAVDEILINPKTQELSPIEFKSTQTKDGNSVKYLGQPYHKTWKNQLEIYGYLLEKNGFKVSEDSFIVFCNASLEPEEWNEKLVFDVQVINYKIDYTWVENVLDKIKDLLTQDKIPSFSDPDHCDMCRYLQEYQEIKI